jgi:hypothetical protein
MASIVRLTTKDVVGVPAMETIFFPGNLVLNLLPHWADPDQVYLIPLNAVGKIIDSHNDSVTVEWEIPEQQYAGRTERPKTSIDLA